MFEELRNCIVNVSQSLLKKWFLVHTTRLFFVLVLTASCTKHREQYGLSQISELQDSLDQTLLEGSNSNSSLVLPSIGQASDRAEVIGEENTDTSQAGSRTVASLSAQDRYRQIRQNSSLPVSYDELSAGGIQVNQNYQDVSPSVHIYDYQRMGNGSVIALTKEGLEIVLEERKVKSIFVSMAYQGLLDFGPRIGQKRVGDSFASFLNLHSPVQKNQVNQDFVRLLYNHFEKTNQDCFEIQECDTYFAGNFFVIKLPKMRLLFTTDERRKLHSITLEEVQSQDFVLVNYQDRSVRDEQVEVVLDVPRGHGLDFGNGIGLRQTLDSFSDVMDLTGYYPEKNLEIKNLIRSLYNNFEEKESDCLQEALCHIEANDKEIMFRLPKMVFVFTKNEWAVLSKMIIVGEKMERSVANRMAPFNYQENFVANISLDMTREEVNQVLYSMDDDQNDRTLYREGLLINWNGNEIRSLSLLSNQRLKEMTKLPMEQIESMRSSYEGSFDFGEEFGIRRLGESFLDQFSLSTKPEEDQKARHFITSVYKHWENKETDCLESQTCQILTDEKSIQFLLPKGVLFFSNDFHRNFTNFNLYGLRIQDQERQTQSNLNQKIDLREQSVASIKKSMTRDEIDDKLQLLEQKNNLSIYREGISIFYDPMSEKPQLITVSESVRNQMDMMNPELLLPYQGVIDFQYDIGLKKIGDSFEDQFDFQAEDISQDALAKQFLISLYNSIYEAEVNCIEEKQCELRYKTDRKDLILFELPTFDMTFENNRTKNLDSIILK